MAGEAGVAMTDPVGEAPRQQPGGYQQVGDFRAPPVLSGFGPPRPPGYVPPPPGFYFDQMTGLTIPNGTAVAGVGRRIAAYFLALLGLMILGVGSVLLGTLLGLLGLMSLTIAYGIWGAVSWSNGQTPVQRVLGQRCWKLRDAVTAGWGTMLLRSLCQWLDVTLCFGLISFVMMLASKDRRTIYDQLSGVVVLYDPDKVLSPAADEQAGAPRRPNADHPGFFKSPSEMFMVLARAASEHVGRIKSAVTGRPKIPKNRGADVSEGMHRSYRRSSVHAFTDGLGGVFDIFGVVRRPGIASPTFEDTVAEDARSLCIALGLIPQTDSTGDVDGRI